MKRERGGQKGQAALLVALMAFFLFGAVALAIDFGFMSDQRRNLQAFADQAAMAGAEQLSSAPTPTQQTNARVSAFEYLRDNLKINMPLGLGQTVTCPKLVPPLQSLTSDLNNCQLPTPNDNYSFTICTPGTTSSGCAAAGGQGPTTVSVNVIDSVTTAIAGVAGISQANVGVVGVARLPPSQRLPFALYSDGCINTGTKLEVVSGDIYSDQCTLTTGAGLQAGFCAEANSSFTGNIEIGPFGQLPANALSGQNLATCTTAAGGVVVATGAVQRVGNSLPTPALPPPFHQPAAGPIDAPADKACVNGINAVGAPRSNCYNEGTYTTLNVANNLNPGVYYVRGDTTKACYQDSSKQYCAGVTFTGNTMNANFGDVKDQCWAAPNSPSTGTFVSPCPDGFTFNPRTPLDPQCSPGGTPLTPPAFTLAALGTGGNLTGALGGTQYYVRVTATSAFALSETTSVEQSIIVPVGTTGSITVTVIPVVGASGYKYYASTSPNSETLTGTTNVITSLSAGAPYPIFDTSACVAGFHNIPTQSQQNYGVTFVLSGKAGLCMNSDANGNCTAPSTPETVLLSPYCSTLPAAACTGANGDGAYVAYGSSQGALVSEGTGSQLGLVGTLYLPKGTIQVKPAAMFQVVPGQAVVHDALFDTTGNGLNPLIFNSGGGALLTQIVQLIQ